MFIEAPRNGFSCLKNNEPQNSDGSLKWLTRIKQEQLQRGFYRNRGIRVELSSSEEKGETNIRRNSAENEIENDTKEKDRGKRKT